MRTPVFVLAAAVLSGCSVSFTGASSLVDLGHIEDSRLLVAEVHAIHVRNNAGSIRVVCDQSDNNLKIAGTVKLRRSRRSEFASASLERDLSVQSVDGVVYVKNAHLDDADHNDWGVDLEIHSPHSLDVTVELGAGNITIYGDPSGVTIDLGTGDVNAKLGVVTGEVRIEDGTGDISLACDEIRGLAALTLGVGDASLQLLSGFPAEGVNIQVGTGAVRLVLPANTGARAGFEVATGDLEVAEAFGLETHSHLIGQSAAGPLADDGPPLEVQVGVGAISLKMLGR